MHKRWSLHWWPSPQMQAAPDVIWFEVSGLHSPLHFPSGSKKWEKGKKLSPSLFLAFQRTVGVALLPAAMGEWFFSGCAAGGADLSEVARDSLRGQLWTFFQGSRLGLSRCWCNWSHRAHFLSLNSHFAVCILSISPSLVRNIICQCLKCIFNSVLFSSRLGIVRNQVPVTIIIPQ